MHWTLTMQLLWLLLCTQLAPASYSSAAYHRSDKTSAKFLSSSKMRRGRDPVAQLSPDWDAGTLMNEEIEGLFSPQLSYLALVLSSTAYAKDAGACYANSGSAGGFGGPLANVTQITVPVTRRLRSTVTFGPDNPRNKTWSGFVGRLPARNLTLAVFRGTKGAAQLLAEILSVASRPPIVSPIGGRVQAYFTRARKAVWGALRPAFSSLRAAYPRDRVLFTGHSLGAALAADGAAMEASRMVNRSGVFLYTFGEPRVGDAAYAAAFDRLLPPGHSWRVVHGKDPVVHLPPCGAVPFASCKHSLKSRPYHHGTEVFYPPDSPMRPGRPGYRVCLGRPRNEDEQCANSPRVTLACVRDLAACIDAHRTYYGLNVAHWWDRTRCRPPAARRLPIDVL